MNDDSDDIRIYGARIRVDHADPDGSELLAPEQALLRLTLTDSDGSRVAVLLDGDATCELAERLLRADRETAATMTAT